MALFDNEAEILFF
jgi:hypothetical protein